MPLDGFAATWLAADVFRASQVHVDMYRRLLTVRSQCPPALMHWTYPLPLVFAGVPNVYTIHDLIPLLAPGLVDTNAARFGRIVRAVAQHADHVVTVSDQSRRDIIRLLGVPEDKVTNTYQPLNLTAGGQAVAPPGRENYFIYCGTIEPRKNLCRLIAAYRQSGTRKALVLAGPDGWRAREELSGANVNLQALDGPPWQRLKEGGVWRVPWLPRPVLIELLRNARALLFPSLAEGFGLPIAEAMALGVPVMTSRGGATEEVAGEAALLINPLDVSEMAEAIAALDCDPFLRQRLSAAGKRRAAMFSPDACLARLAAVYASLGVACA
jgi:glycosyltransferase involved in cell wall biosynthesis